jgi:hypothetical protein
MKSARLWPEPYVAGISLTYDGSSEEQLEEVVPVLNRHGLKGTFFADPTELIGRIQGWREVALRHELANGFLHGSVDEDGFIPDWPPETFGDEMQDAEILLQEIIGERRRRSFALPCVRIGWGDGGLPVVERIILDTIVRVNEETLRPLIDHRGFHAVRSPIQGFNDPGHIDPLNVKCFVADSMNADSLCTATHIGVSQGAWVVLVFNASRFSTLDQESHARFVEWLAESRENVMIDTFGEMARLVSSPADVRI